MEAENTIAASTPTELLNGFGGVVRTDGQLGAERLDELQPLLADVDAHHLVAEGRRDLDGVVAEAPGGTHDRHVTSRLDVVLEEFLDGAIRREAATAAPCFFITHRVRQFYERLGPHAELLSEGAIEALDLGAVARFAAQAELAGAAPVAA